MARSTRVSNESSRLPTQTDPPPPATGPGRTPVGRIAALEHPVRRGVDRGDGVRRDDDRSFLVAEEKCRCDCSEGESGDRGADEDTPAPRPLQGWLHRGCSGRRLLGLGDGGNRERPVLAQDRGLEVAELLAGLEPELVVQPRAQAAIDLERVRLPPGAVQGEHQLGVQALLVGVLGDEGLERSDELRVPAQLELGVDLLHLHDEPEVCESRERVAIRPLELDVRERRSPPQRKCALAQLDRPRKGLRARGLRKALELGEVERARVDDETVAGGTRLEHVRPELLAQRVHVALDELLRRHGRPLPPELFDEAGGRDRLVRVQQQHREQRALLRSAEPHGALTVADLEWTEDQELHRAGADRTTEPNQTSTRAAAPLNRRSRT